VAAVNGQIETFSKWRRDENMEVSEKCLEERGKQNIRSNNIHSLIGNIK
jgi:hypothetical protein